MTRNVISAVPDRLAEYARRATAVDSDLRLRAGRLWNRLEHFEARCGEPGFEVRALRLADSIGTLANECGVVDRLVGKVARGFLVADSRGGDYGRSSHLQAFAAPWGTISAEVSDSVWGEFWSVGPTPVPGWLIGILPLLPWVQRIWQSGPAESSHPQEAGVPRPIPRPTPTPTSSREAERESVDGAFKMSPDWTSGRGERSGFDELHDCDEQCDEGDTIDGGECREVDSAETADNEMGSSRPLPSRIDDPRIHAPWTQVDALITNAHGQRSASVYRDVIDQFDVQHSYPGRYRPDDSTPDTRCNIFAGDVMRAMGAPLPIKGDLGVGHGEARDSDPMTANAKHTHEWLTEETDGWGKVNIDNAEDLQALQDHLAAGKPALASDQGHVAVLRPDGVPDFLTRDNLGSLRIAQAGRENYNNIALGEAGYGTLLRPDFFIHDSAADLSVTRQLDGNPGAWLLKAIGGAGGPESRQNRLGVGAPCLPAWRQSSVRSLLVLSSQWHSGILAPSEQEEVQVTDPGSFSGAS